MQGPNGVRCGVQRGLLYNNNCTCDVSKWKISKNNFKSPKSKHGVQIGWGMGSKQDRLTSIYNKSIVPSM